MKLSEIKIEFRDGVFEVEGLGELLGVGEGRRASGQHHDFLIRQFGSLMRQIRQAAGLRQDRAAQLIGISVRCLSQLENGRNHEFATFLRLMEAYGVHACHVCALLEHLLLAYVKRLEADGK